MRQAVRAAHQSRGNNAHLEQLWNDSQIAKVFAVFRTTGARVGRVEMTTVNLVMRQLRSVHQTAGTHFWQSNSCTSTCSDRSNLSQITTPLS
jgi:hypothetical protein